MSEPTEREFLAAQRRMALEHIRGSWARTTASLARGPEAVGGALNDAVLRRPLLSVGIAAASGFFTAAIFTRAGAASRLIRIASFVAAAVASTALRTARILVRDTLLASTFQAFSRRPAPRNGVPPRDPMSN